MSELETLKAELARLQAQIKAQAQPKETTVTVSEYKGHPVIQFAGPFRPFTLGAGKCRVLVENIDKVRAFVAQNKNAKDEE